MSSELHHPSGERFHIRPLAVNRLRQIMNELFQWHLAVATFEVGTTTGPDFNNEVSYVS